MGRKEEEDASEFVTNEAHIADLAAIHNALASIGGTLSKIEHALTSEDARAKQAALKDVSARVQGAIDAIGAVETHIGVAEFMAELSGEELSVLRERLGGVDDDDE